VQKQNFISVVDADAPRFRPFSRSLSLSSTFPLFLSSTMRPASSQSPSAAPGGAAGDAEKGGEIESLAGLWSTHVADDARSLASSFGRGAALELLVEETRNVEQVVAGGVHEV